MTNEIIETDVAIIGAGPVGLFAVFQCGMLGLSTHVIDALDMIGGQCTALYPEKPIFDIPAHPTVTGQELINNLAAQAAPFKPTYHLNQQVMEVNKTTLSCNAEGWELMTSLGNKIRAKVVMIAAGVGAFGPNKPPLEGLEKYEASAVHYYVKKREDFRDKRIVIAGGGDSAVDWAVSLSELAEHIYVVHRRDKFRAAPDTVSKMHALAAEGKIEMVTPYQLARLEGANGELSGVVVKTLQGEARTLEADTLLPFFGLSMKLGPIAEWGLNLDNKQITVDPVTAETSEKGIYAIGDIVTYDHKLKLILCGFAEAAQAAHGARKLCHPEQDFHFEYSTTKGVPGQKDAA